MSVEGVWKIEMLGPYGWEAVSTAFVENGRYLGASQDHYTIGHYEVWTETINGWSPSRGPTASSQNLFGDGNPNCSSASADTGAATRSADRRGRQRAEHDYPARYSASEDLTVRSVISNPLSDAQAA